MKSHHGYSVKRIREILQIKQETLANRLGMSQQNISAIENKESIDQTILEKVANALDIPVDTIKNFNEDKAINIFSNSYHDNSSIGGNYYANSVDKIIQLYEDKIALYERMLRDKDVLIDELRKIHSK